MDQPKIERTLRLIKLMTGNVSYTVDELARKLDTSYRSIYRYIETFKDAGFAVQKVSSGVYKLSTMDSRLPDISKLVYFSEEEAYIVGKLIESLDNTNTLKQDLHRKLASIYSSTSISNFIDRKSNAETVEKLNSAVAQKRKVILKGYRSSNSGSTRDRLVEPFGMTTNFIQVWAFDLEDGRNKLFQVSRIEEVEVLDEEWTKEKEHKEGKIDIFRMHGFSTYPVKLSLGMLSKNLLVEEYPLAEKFLSKKDGRWILETEVCGMAGIGRFVIGLADDIQILDAPELEDYISDFVRKNLSRG